MRRSIQIRCGVFGCDNKAADRVDGIHFFRLPNTEKTRAEWLLRCAVPRTAKTSYHYVCSQHFAEENLIISSHSIKLKAGTFPTRNLPSWRDIARRNFIGPINCYNYPRTRKYKNNNKNSEIGDQQTVVTTNSTEMQHNNDQDIMERIKVVDPPLETVDLDRKQQRRSRVAILSRSNLLKTTAIDLKREVTIKIENFEPPSNTIADGDQTQYYDVPIKYENDEHSSVKTVPKHDVIKIEKNEVPITIETDYK